MTSETALIIALIIGAFGLFAVTLAAVAVWSNRGPQARRPIPQTSSENDDLRYAA